MDNRTILRCLLWTNLLHFIKLSFKFHGQKNLAGYTVHGAPVSWIQLSDWIHRLFHASQFSSVGQSCLTLCNPMDCSTPGFPVLNYLLDFAQMYVHWVDDAIQPSHPLSPFSSCPQSFPASGPFSVNWLFASGSQSITASASASVLPMTIRD